jgi:hypothetical protein
MVRLSFVCCPLSFCPLCFARCLFSVVFFMLSVVFRPLSVVCYASVYVYLFCLLSVVPSSTLTSIGTGGVVLPDYYHNTSHFRYNQFLHMFYVVVYSRCNSCVNKKKLLDFYIHRLSVVLPSVRRSGWGCTTGKIH